MNRTQTSSKARTKKLVDGAKSERKPNPVTAANPLSQLTFWWLRRFLMQGMRGHITSNDIYEAKDSLKSGPITERMSALWQQELKRPKPSLMRMLLASYGWPVLLWGLLFMLIETVCRVAMPLCLGGLVGYFAHGQTDYTKADAYWFSFGIFVSTLAIIVTFHPFFLWLQERSAVIRLGCSGLMYGKIMRMPRSAVSEGLNGRLINLLSNDVTRFELALMFFHDVWKGPSETILFCYFIYREIGIAAVIGIGFLLSFVPIQAWMGKRAATLRLKTALRTDYRVKIMNEILHGIQVIKMYAWENSFAQLVDRIRKKEVVAVRQTAFVRATLTAFGMISRLSIFISLLAYIFLGNVLTARKVFIVSSFFTILNFSMVFQWTYAITCVAEGYVSVKRIQEFLLMSEQKASAAADEAADTMAAAVKSNGKPQFDANIKSMQKHAELVDAKPVDDDDDDKDVPAGRRTQNEQAAVKGVRLDGATARWTSGDDGTIGIQDMTLRIEAGELCAIVGQVGAGKSTLLQVMLGELALDEGRIRIDGRLSYAPQEAWLFEGTIRSNIVFIEEYDEKRYRQVVHVCALERDFELLPHGDRTVVGERGISLSGGQKARINLARAVYKRADVYLLDDPLSAVDTHVGKHMFHECVRGFLHDKIVVLVTHQLQHLRDVQRVVVLQRGRLEAQGTFAELRDQRIEALLSTPDESGGQREAAERKHQKTATMRSRSGSSIHSLEHDDDVGVEMGGQADRSEHTNEGRVGWDVYARFLDAVQSRFYVLALFVMFIVAQVGLSGVDYFVAQWVNWEASIVDSTGDQITTYLWGDEATTDAQHRMHFVLIYCALMAVASYVFIHRTFAFYIMCLRATTNLHDHVFRGVSRATMLFFNTNPSGRILNRFSKDIGNIDVLLPPALMDSLSMLIECVAVLSIIVSVSYWLIVPTIVLIVLIFAIRHMYIQTARAVKRFESVSLSPVYSHANATLQGLTTVRAFGADSILQSEFHRHMDLNSGDWYCRVATTRAFAFWLDMVNCLYIGAVTLSFVTMQMENTQGGNVGLAILQCTTLIGMCQWGIRQTAEVESQMTSVERLLEYANLPAEAALESEPAAKPPAEWPQSGAIEFEQLSFRYTPDGAFVLSDLNLSIAPREKIGVVGRTGAGKSSLIQALFRLAEPDGAIVVDGVDTRRLGLHDLRRKISIIPQDPILFSGTLRFNLDPFAERSDDEMWHALEQVELRPFVADQVGGLDCKMLDGGSNFSVGQRQLVCLARAILRNNRILILDEATANVDPETDRLIQTTIRKRFDECTVLTIAHRLHTVMDSDRVLVIDAGRAMEFAHPWELMQQESGALRQLVDQTGSETAAILLEIAHKNFTNKDKNV